MINEEKVAKMIKFKAKQNIFVECQQDSALQGVNQHTETDFIER